MSKALLLCRGSSLERISEIKDEKFDTYILVNKWDEQLHMPEFAFLEGKKIWHFINREPHNIMSSYLYKHYKIDKTILNILQQENVSSAVRQILLQDNIIADYMCEKVSEFATNGKSAFPSGGVSALAHLTCCAQFDEITVIGMDFFQADYFTYHSSMGGKEVRDYQKKKNSNMLPFVLDFCEKNFNTKFRFVTKAKIKECPTNVEVS